MTTVKPTARGRAFVAAAALAIGILAQKHGLGQTSCNAAPNPTVCENQNPGNPKSQWDVNGAGDDSIQGFATQISVSPGQVEQFKVDTTASAFTLDIYRMGYYKNGEGARQVASGIVGIPKNQPACLSNAATGLIDCGNWTVSASWTVPSTAVSGIYFAKLTRADTGGASHVFFIVRESPSAAHHSDMVFQTSDTTWQAYNQYGGNSLYTGQPAGRAYKVSYNRPFVTRGSDNGQDWVFNAEYPMVRWLEANGYDVSYISGVDTDRDGSSLLQHKVFLSVGHDEYWSGAQRTNVEAARAAGVNLAFFSGNEVFWKTRWEDSIDGSGTPYRTLVCYKETHANAKLDPLDPPTWTGTWADPRFSPPADGGRPQNALTGQLFGVNDGDTTAISIPAALGKHRFWRDTSVATLAAGATATMPVGTLGYEWDTDVDNGFLPPRLMRLSQTTKSVAGKLLDYGSTFGAGTVTHALTLYRVASGALVFGAGTVQWSWGLDANHDRGSTAADVRMKQATVNLFADMGVQPGTLQAGLVGESASTDALAPTSTIVSPVNGASVVAGTALTINGTASDAGGGIVVGVEVSTDGGTTWRAATGGTSWSFSWNVAGSGPVTLRSRAYDDSGNVETPSAGVAITISGSRTCPCSIWASTVTPPAPLDDGDTASVELGDRFRTDTNGFITGVRFYKGTANTGTHTGSLWTNAGVLLGTATFNNETASGWQQVLFTNPVAVTANTTYVVSYHAPNGHYTGTDAFYAAAAVDSPPLHALRNGTDGPNGVYAYGATTTFPAATFNSENYWVDVVFSTTAPVDTSPPTVTSTFPTNNAVGVDPGARVTVGFNEAMDPNSISSSTSGSEGGGTAFGTFELRDSASTLINATVSYDAATRVATLQPASALALSTKYTALVKGGAADPRVKDAAGNAMAANVTWSFTTAGAPPPPGSCPCSIWPASTVPSVVTENDAASVELGTKFRSDVSGYVTGAKFYKGPANTGTHTASLWTSTGTRLATATFAAESASGWQQVAFPSPVQIAANTTYVVSYHAPGGEYSASASYFSAAGVDSPPLHALQNGVDGPNGVYVYGSTSVFPSQTFGSTSYFVDVVFNTTIGPDLTPPTEALVTPASGASGVSTSAALAVTFNEALDPATATGTNFILRDASNATVPAVVTYSASTLTVTVTPTSALSNSAQYTAVVRAGVKDLAGNATTSDFTWSFTTAAPPPPPPSQGPGGPVLVVTAAANPFTTYLAEILRGEGVNEFLTKDVSQVTATVLDAYDVVLLGEMPLTAAQVSMFTTWVNAGGNLIAMRPDKQLAGLMGLTDKGTTLADAYLLVNTAAAPGAGIVNQTIQFHGNADNYSLNGATSLATLYSTATSATTSPAVTSRTVGLGRAVAFTYDLAKSVVYTRQGNPAWAGQERDGQTPSIIRSDDLFFGAKAGDVKPDYVDLNKVAIPQADEQQRFLWNIMLNVNASNKPLLRFWYFPRMLPAAVIMTGDDHALGGTAGRFNDFIAASPANCSVADWGCVRGTSYIYPGTPISDAQVTSYQAQGFEIALHVTTNCADWTPASLAGFYSSQLTQFAAGWPHAFKPTTNRTHCIVWSDWSTQAQVALNNGIRLDTNYYYWPDVWILDRPGMFTGSGMPQRFADTNGQMIDVYQATTQITDESGQTFSTNIDALLNNATGSLGYYGAFTVNMHTDYNPSAGETGATAIVASAKAHGVPVITARQALDWLDGRNGSSFKSIAWNGSALTFDIAVGTGANGLRALVPATWGSRPITGMLLNGAPLSFVTQTIKGVQYATFAATPGTYQVSYGADTTPPAITAIATVPSATGATVSWTTNEAADSIVTYGTDPAVLTQNVTNTALVTAHSVAITGLEPNTTYYMRVSSADAAGNRATSPATGSAPLVFTTSALSISGSLTPGQFGSGATLTVTGPLNPITAADGSGNYSVGGLASGDYTVTPSKTGYSFAPLSRSVTLTNANATAVNFTVSAVVISGSISPVAAGSGATVTLAGAMNASVTADSSGVFSFVGVANGDYTVSATKAGFTFSPASQAVTIAGGTSATGVTFTGQPIPTWTISGTVAGGPGAAVALTGAATRNATADASGNYSFAGLANGSYAVAATKAGFTVLPATQPVTVNGADVVGVNFTAQAIPTFSLSGTVTAVGAGATVALTGGATTTADASGNYAFTGLVNGTYVVTPTKPGVTMTPTSQSVTIAGASATGVNFTAAIIPSTLAIDATVTTGRSTRGTTIASPAFSTTTSNQLVLAMVAADNVSSAATTVTGVTGGGLTWVLVRRTNTQRGTAEIWRTFAASPLTSVAATATLSQNVAAAITVMSFKGVVTSGTSGSGAIGATGSGSGATGAPTASLTTTRANSLVVGIGDDWDSAIPRTVGSNQTIVTQYLATVGDTFWVQRTTSTTPAAGTVVTINDTAPTTDRFNLTICEVLSGS
jgi:hypothetical protein